MYNPETIRNAAVYFLEEGKRIKFHVHCESQQWLNKIKIKRGPIERFSYKSIIAGKMHKEYGSNDEARMDDASKV